MWGEKREGEGNQTPKFPFSIKRKISKNLGLSSKVCDFFFFFRSNDSRTFCRN